jgi:hypothetical protein
MSRPAVRVVNTNAIKCGPFTFERDTRDADRGESWNVKLPKGVELTRFCVKNYGGKPSNGNAFSGWRVVSGGPFTDAGGWTTRDDAIAGATPWLIAYYQDDAEQRHAEAVRTLKALKRFLGVIR